MLKKIYFGDKPLFLTDTNSEEIKQCKDDKRTIVFNNPGEEEINSVIKQMVDSAVTSGIIFKDVAKSFEMLTKEFTVILASGGLVHTKNDKILLIFRRGKWDLPKGKLDEGEDLVECALREVKEETGLSSLAFEHFFYTSYHTYFEGNKHILKESHWHLLSGNDKEDLMPQTDEDIDKCEWVSIDKLSPYLENAPASIIDVLKEGTKILSGLKKV